MPKYLVTVVQPVSMEWWVNVEAESEAEAKGLAVARVFGEPPFEDAEPVDHDNYEPLDAPEAVDIRLAGQE